MEVADALYGVTMRGDGVTTVISQRLREHERARTARGGGRLLDDCRQGGRVRRGRCRCRAGGTAAATEQPQASWHEQDATQWWTATRDALADVVAQLADRRPSAPCA